ncbi:MAG: DUF1573 domain-containing protein [Acidobacteriota bacterium]
MKSRLSVLLFSLTLLLAIAVDARTLQDKKPKLFIGSLEYSFGTVSAGTPLNYSFKLQNIGDGNLEIKNVEPACGCTASDYDKVIAPGKEGKISLSIKDTESYNGDVVKTATVTTNDPARPTFTLTLRATFTRD